MLTLWAPLQARADAPGLRLVVVDPGHGGANEGAPARFDPGRFEKHHTLAIAERLAAHLRAAGVSVVMTREEDRELSLKARIGLANRLAADVFVSVHLNATERAGPVGHETFFLAVSATDEAARRLVAFENAEPTAVAHAAGAGLPEADAVQDILLDLTRQRAHGDAGRLAALIQDRMTAASPFPNRGVRQAPFFVLMGAAMPAVVCEIGFINHPREGRFVVSPEGQIAIARALADGVLDFGRLVLAPRQVHEVSHVPTP
mgnify:CR=1 FL=1